MRRSLSRLTRIEIEHVEVHANFTETEEAVFRLLCRDKSSVQIQMALHVSSATVSRIKRRIFDKIDTVMRHKPL